MRVLKCLGVLTIIMLVLLLIPYCFFVFCDESGMVTSLLNTFIGIVSTIAFGLWVSYAFQYANDRREKRKTEEIKTSIRSREFAPLTLALTRYVREINIYENKLICRFPFLKSSFTQKHIDIDNFQKNLFVFWYAEEHIDALELKQNENSIRENCKILFMLDKEEFKISPMGTPRLYTLFQTVNQACMQLKTKMPEYNENYKAEIFSEKEINAVRELGWEIGMYVFWHEPPSQILETLLRINDIAEFLDVDFIPFCQKTYFAERIEWALQEEDRKEKQYFEWKEKNMKIAESLFELQKQHN